MALVDPGDTFSTKDHLFMILTLILPKKRPHREGAPRSATVLEMNIVPLKKTLCSHNLHSVIIW